MKNLIETNVGNKVIVHSYPYGKYSDTSEAILKELGFKFSLTVNPGISNINEGFELKRINVPNYKSYIQLTNEILELQNQPFRINKNGYY